ncbi:hypothetical protein BofuT4_P145960.1 [Botrytis cinerea T4]|uniref:Uncharacterized protein n=1 Tax=Botryotinia fuckeliana (strain T4) TaxID=999810 RepID=G2YXS9_BOTF4|nr:hypothetical protein BofuT4_P145960.1 [Botrytis cinerea T4]
MKSYTTKTYLDPPYNCGCCPSNKDRSLNSAYFPWPPRVSTCVRQRFDSHLFSRPFPFHPMKS